MFILTYLDEMIWSLGTNVWNLVPAPFGMNDTQRNSQTPPLERGPRKQQDLIVKITGSFGRYQFWICVMVFAPKIAIAVHQMSIIYLAPNVKYMCSGVPNLCPCDNPVYDRSTFSKTMVTEFNLICDRKWLANLSQTIFQLGTLIGNFFFGAASDRYGRRDSLITACIMQIVFGIGTAFTRTYEWHTLFRFLVGVSVGGTMVITFVIVMEFIGPQYREVIAALYQIPFNIGHMLLPLAAYYYRDYISLQVVISVPELLFLLYFFFLPESPRWLIAMKRTDEAIEILEDVAQTNHLPTDTVRADTIAYQQAVERNKLRTGTAADLFRTPNLKKYTLVMGLNLFACSYCFYGVSQYVGRLGGDVFMNVLCSAFFTLVGTFVSIPIMRFFGRRHIIIVCHVICTISLFLLGLGSDGLTAVMVSSFGVLCSFMVFVVAYMYCGELFPTVVRNTALGVTSMMARVGSMLAPFASESPVALSLFPICAIFATMVLPETKGCELTTTLDEGERNTFVQKKKEPGA